MQNTAGEVRTFSYAKTYLQQLCTDKRCSLEDLLGAMDDKDEWQEKVREIHVHSTTWCVCVCVCVFCNFLCHNYKFYIFIKE